jgi:2-enoate reductase
VVNLPVIAHGKLNDPFVAEQVLVRGDADFIAVGHQFLADPDWPNKVKEGRYADIRHCVGCNECLHVSQLGRIRNCAINPICAMEIDYPFIRAEQPRKVLVIGGGPAGMETAIFASQRGHRVELWEKSGALGGNLIPAGAPKFKKDVKKYLAYLIHTLHASNVIVHMNKDASVDAVIAGNYDYVALATGSRPQIPPIEGVEGKNVITGNDALLGEPLAGKVVVIGGGLVGCEAVAHIAETAEEVTLVEMLDDILRTVQQQLSNDQCLRQMVKDSKAFVYCGARATKITADGVEIEKDGKAMKIACDTVVIATGQRPNNELEEQLYDKVKNLRLLGDALSPRKIMNAVGDGYHYARTMK